MVFEKYKHLIKSNNKFFVSGSVSAELTDSGLNIDVPPTQALISGSISFTSEGKGYKQKKAIPYLKTALLLSWHNLKQKKKHRTHAI